MNNQYIKRYINFHTSQQVRYRGKKLYENKAVKSAIYNEKMDSWLFKVQGSKEYLVQVLGLTNNNIAHTSCTCPFDWGGMCKHTVAALMYLQDNDIENITGEKELIYENRNNKGFLEIENYELITNKFVEKNCNNFVLSRMPYYSQFFDVLKKTTINKDNIIFKVSNYNNNSVNVTIFKEKNKVYIKSDEVTSVSKGFKLSEAICLQIIAISKTPNLLDIVFNNKTKGIEQEIIKDYGLKPSDFSKYFKLDFDINEGLKVYKKKNNEGIIPIVENKKSYVNNVLQTLTTTSFTIKEQAKEKRELGFVVKYDSSYDDSLFDIIPIIAKTNKTEEKLATKFEEYNDIHRSEYLLSFSDNQKKILNELNELEYLADDEEEEFYLSQRIIRKLSKEKFVFNTDYSGYKIRKSDLSEITVSNTPVKLIFEVSQKSKFIKANLQFKLYEKIITPKNVIIDSGLIEYQNVLYSIADYNSYKLINELPSEIKMVKTHKDVFFKQVIEPLSKNNEIVFLDNSYTTETINLDFNKKQIFLSEQDDYLVITPQVVYDNNTTVILSEKGDIITNIDNKITTLKRNFELEEQFIDSVVELHPNFERQKSNKIFYLHNLEFTNDMWFYGFFDKMQQNNVDVFGLKDLKNFKYSPYKGKISTSVKSGQDWFDVNIEVSFGDNLVRLKDIRKAIINKQKYIQLKDGSVGIIPSEWLNKLEKHFRNGKIVDDKLQISKLRFSIIDEMFDDIDDADIIEEINEKKKRISEFNKIDKIKIPTEIKAKLRDYQKEGLNWLNFLDKMKWGGILADDMGLGKTLQILAFIQHIIKKDKTPNLIVLPTTILFNWEKEIEKFAPKLKAFYHYGADRKKEVNHFKKYNIIFTSYGVLLRDIEYLSKFKFNYLILDESQAIKNPASRRYKSAVLINAKNRIALTGTPIENGTFDLFAQMNFANPGMFGGVKSFKDNYSIPIDKDGDELIASELQRIINPFVLRRTKENVASELPPKTEDIIYCEMEKEQQQVYDAYRNEYRDNLLNKISEDGMGKSKLMVLEALTRLRQICDSPVLLKSDEIETQQSIKIKEILRHIKEKTSNHKVLIFSQFVGMLSILKDELNKLNISYEYLDGKCSIKQREQSVNNFQNNENLRVFLISLKAGGTGLNLTAADYVYILDPWWNPAVENQAIDRCYRIGQNKNVFAYRMICKNTVEEKIMNLQAKKTKIASDIIQTDENIMKTINANDIKELFS